jgi:hypothetical protein
MARNGKEWQGMARNGKEWQGMARNGKEWQGMARNGKEWQGKTRESEPDPLFVSTIPQQFSPLGESILLLEFNSQCKILTHHLTSPFLVATIRNS